MLNLSAIDNSPWAISDTGLETLREALGSFSADSYAKYKDFAEKRQARISGEDGSRYSARVESVSDSGDAVVNVAGIVLKYESFWSWLLGAVTSKGLEDDLAKLDSDPAVKRIILRVDSPGGQASGMQELAAFIRDGMSTKTVAYVDGLAASAGYWIASAADEIVVNESSEGGSIGVIAFLRIRSESGVIKVISEQSPKKDIDPKKDADLKLVQERVDELAGIFIGDVARFRGVSEETVASDFGRGWVLGGKAMVAAGMADRLGFLKDLLSEEINMNADELKAKHPELYNSIVQDGVKAGVQQGVQQGREAEAKRRSDVLAQALPGHEALVDEMLNDGKTTGPEAAQRILQAERARQAEKSKQQRAEATQPVPASPAPEASAGQPRAKGEESGDNLESKWKDDPDLRAEFGDDYDSFIAYHKAMGEGLVQYIRN